MLNGVKSDRTINNLNIREMNDNLVQNIIMYNCEVWSLKENIEKTQSEEVEKGQERAGGKA